MFVAVLLLAFVTGCGKSSSGGKKEGAESYDSLVVLTVQYEMGRRYHEGDGVKKDYEKAVDWLAKAAVHGYARAQCGLGLCYKNGDGVEQDFGMAVEWFTKAAMQGDVDAQFFLAECYDDGKGVEKDSVKAFEWLKKAAE